MATAAGVPGADLIPDGSELFLGFTSTQRNALGPPRIVNFETLGLVDLGPRSYFHGGTHMHLSHIFEDLEAWYLNLDFRERVNTTFRPRLPVREGTQTVPQPPHRVASENEVRRDYNRFGAIGHSSSLQPASRLQQDIRGSDGTLYPKGTAIPQRADFNTLDNPFFWSADPKRDRMGEGPAAGPPLRRLQPDERRLPSQPARDGRRHARRREADVRSARARPGLQLDPADDAPAELPRPAAAPPLVPARRA